MLTHSNISSSAEGVNYYSDCKIIDCEGKSLEISGWYGKGSKEIGLVGKVKMSDFKNILEGKINYKNKEIKLGIKTNDSNDLIHASGTDFTFNAPKSVSNQANMIGGDRRINDSILQAAKETFDYIEKNYVYSRVKVAGQVIKEKVDNVVGAYFMENLNRENEYHSHVHFTFANMVQKQNGDWRSAEFRSIVENEKFLGAVFRMNLAHEMVKLGYEIEFTDTDQHFFEIRGSNKEFNNFTSQRTQNIIAKALEINPSNPNAKLKQIANLLTRANKKITGDNLVKLNEFRISEFFRKTKINILNNIKQLTKQANNSSATIDSKEIAKYAVKNAIEHHSERKSVFLKQDIISFALREVKGKCNLSHLLKEIDNFEKKKL